METFMRALLIAGLTAISALAQCSAPEFFGSSEILAIGERAFSVVNGGNGGCSTGGLSGNVWLVRPGDSSFQAIQMGYFDATNGTSPNNTIKAPSVSSPGYGYRIIIASDPSSTPIAASPTFSLVTNDWYTQSYNHLALVYPSPQSDSSSWSSSGDQLIAYQAFEDFGQNTFTVLLYNAEDATQAPTTVASSVPIPSLDQTTDEYYFTIENTLPTGSKYQLVLVPSADATDKVLSMSGLIQIASGSGSPGSFPYTYTQVRTIGGGSVTVTQASTTSLPSSDGASTSASSMLPVENPYPSRTPSNTPSGASNSTTASSTGSTSSTSTSSGSSAASASSSTSSSTTSVSSTTLTSGGTTLVVPANTQPSPNIPVTQAGQPASGSSLPQAGGAANSAAAPKMAYASHAFLLTLTPLIALLFT